MNKSRYIFIITIIIILGISFTLYIHRIPFENLIVKDSDFIAYFENDKDLSKNIENYLVDSFDDENRTNKLIKSYKNINKNLKRFFILGLGNKNLDYRPIDKQDLLIILDFGYKYPLAKFTVNEYFHNTEKGIILKEKYKKDLTEKNILKKHQDIYLFYYKSYYILSLNPKTLIKYKSLLKENTTNHKLVEQIKFKNMYAIDFENFMGNFFKDNNISDVPIDIICGKINFYDNNIKIRNSIIFNDSKLDFYFKDQYVKSLDKFIQNKQGLYISNKNLLTFISTIFIGKKLDNNNINLNNINWDSLQDKFGDELYIDFENKSAVIKILDINFFRFILNFISKRENENTYIIDDKFKIIIVDNYLFINEEIKESNFKTLKNNDFLYLNINGNFLLNLFGINKDKDLNFVFSGEKNKNDIQLDIEIKNLNIINE